MLLSLLSTDTSEQLEARRAPEKPEPQHIPGLSLKPGSRQRLSSPAPIAQTAPVVNRPPPQSAPTPRAAMSPPAMGHSAAYLSFIGSPPAAGMMGPRSPGKVSSPFSDGCVPVILKDFFFFFLILHNPLSPSPSQQNTQQNGQTDKPNKE